MKDVEKFREKINILLVKTHSFGMNNEYMSIKEESKKTNELNKLKQELIKMYEERKIDRTIGKYGIGVE